jgi:hypothetical protein
MSVSSRIKRNPLRSIPIMTDYNNKAYYTGRFGERVEVTVLRTWSLSTGEVFATILEEGLFSEERKIILNSQLTYLNKQNWKVEDFL